MKDKPHVVAKEKDGQVQEEQQEHPQMVQPFATSLPVNTLKRNQVTLAI